VMVDAKIEIGDNWNMNDCRVAVNQWAKKRIPTMKGDAVVGTGSWNQKYERNDLFPCDIANAVYHVLQQTSSDGAGEAASAMSRDGANEDQWPVVEEEIPF